MSPKRRDTRNHSIGRMQSHGKWIRQQPTDTMGTLRRADGAWTDLIYPTGKSQHMDKTMFL
jgi:hypothetical protein